MQRLNRDVAMHLVEARGSTFQVIHPSSRSMPALISFCLRSIVAAARSGRNTRIHVGDAAALPLGVLCRWIGGGSLSCTACGLDVIYPKPWYQAIVRFCLQRCDQVISISHATAEELRKRGVSDSRITVIPCGINPTDRAHSSTRDPHLLVTVGRLVQRKGVAWFLEQVFPPLLTAHPHLRYIIIGDGPERQTIASIIDRLHLHESVSLWTDASDDARLSMLHTASVFVAPNVRVPGDMEGFGIVCLEAGESGLQVAAANIEGLTDAVIDGQTGRLFASRNTDDCMRMIDEMLKRPLDPVSVRMKTLDHFSWNRLIPLYNDVFDR